MSSQSPSELRPILLVDCDPGIDDSLALLWISKLVTAGLVDLVLVTVVGGNSTLSQVYSNASFVCRAAGLKVPVVPGSRSPLELVTDPIDVSNFHGRWGLGEVKAPAAELPSMSSACSCIAQQLRRGKELGRRTYLLATGPLTNIARVFQKDPDVAGLIDRLVVMGGALGSPNGNVTPHAEFNFYSDPVAAELVLSRCATLEIVPLDATTMVGFDSEDLSRLANGRNKTESGLACRLLRSSLTLHEKETGRRVAYLHDVVATAAVFRPDFFEHEKSRLKIETAGARAGNVSTSHRGGHRATVLRKPDSEELRAEFICWLTRE